MCLILNAKDMWKYRSTISPKYFQWNTSIIHIMHKYWKCCALKIDHLFILKQKTISFYFIFLDLHLFLSLHNMCLHIQYKYNICTLIKIHSYKLYRFLTLSV